MIFKQVLAPDIEGNGDVDTPDMKDTENYTLYEFLIELFGERLILMLESRKKYPKSQQQSLSNDQKKSEGFTNEQFSLTNLQVRIDEAFRRHQMREGFVSLHHLVSSQRLVTMKKPLLTRSMNCRPFCIRMYRLPIIHNVLELSSGTTLRGGFKKDGCQTSDGIIKGKLRGRRHHFLTSSIYTISGVGSYWL